MLQAGPGLGVSLQLSAALPPGLVASGPVQPQLSCGKPQCNGEVLFGLGPGWLRDWQCAWHLGSLGWRALKAVQHWERRASWSAHCPLQSSWENDTSLTPGGVLG